MRQTWQQMMVLLALLTASSAMAEVVNRQDEAPQGESPKQAEAWLALQREGGQASLNKQPLSGPAMENIHQRYLDSFTRPIPERFDHGQINRQ